MASTGRIEFDSTTSLRAAATAHRPEGLAGGVARFAWGWGWGWGYYPSGGLGLLFIIILILLLRGRI